MTAERGLWASSVRIAALLGVAALLAACQPSEPSTNELIAPPQERGPYAPFLG